MSAAPPQKVWQVWPGSHSFCCDGRFMVGPDAGVTLFAFALVTGASVGFWVFVCPSLHVAFLLGGVLVYITTVGFMAATAITDPGILPRCVWTQSPRGLSGDATIYGQRALAGAITDGMRTDACALRSAPPSLAPPLASQQPQPERRRGRSVRVCATVHRGERRACAAQVVPHLPHLPAAARGALLGVQRVRREVRPPLPVDGSVHRPTQLPLLSGLCPLRRPPLRLHSGAPRAARMSAGGAACASRAPASCVHTLQLPSPCAPGRPVAAMRPGRAGTRHSWLAAAPSGAESEYRPTART